jgi:hypothetical protein
MACAERLVKLLDPNSHVAVGNVVAEKVVTGVIEQPLAENYGAVFIPVVTGLGFDIQHGKALGLGGADDDLVVQFVAHLIPLK